MIVQNPDEHIEELANVACTLRFVELLATKISYGSNE